MKRFSGVFALLLVVIPAHALQRRELQYHLEEIGGWFGGCDVKFQIVCQS